MKMNKYRIKLDTVEQVQSFISIMWNVESDAIIRSEDRKYAVDAKSIMGIYSLDLSKTLILEINGEEELTEKFVNANIFVEVVNE
jgi:phosphotransferase system HPr-like phosphotransfer protein